MTVAEVEEWRDRFLLGAENALWARPKDEDALKDEQIKKLKQKVGELVLDLHVLEEASKDRPFSPKNVRRVRQAMPHVSERRACRILEVTRSGMRWRVRRPARRPALNEPLAARGRRSSIERARSTRGVAGAIVPGLTSMEASHGHAERRIHRP